MLRHIITALLSIYISIGFAQTDIVNFATASHPIEVLSVTHTKQNTTVRLRLTNQISGGYFCLSDAVVATNPEQNYRLFFLRSEGIPVCPEQHHFALSGEQLEFSILFNRFTDKLPYVNIIEQCEANCLEIRGLVLDQHLNQAINTAYDFYATGQYQLAADSYIRLIESNPGYPFAIHYFNAIHALAAQKNWAQAKIWYKKLQQSQLSDTQANLNRLRTMPYFDKIL